MIKYTITHLLVLSLLLFTGLFFTDTTFADNNEAQYEQHYTVKELKASGKIDSLENILMKLSGYNIKRLLEIELKQDISTSGRQFFIYEIEYLNHTGIVLEIMVDALTAEVLCIEKEY